MFTNKWFLLYVVFFGFIGFFGRGGVFGAITFPLLLPGVLVAMLFGHGQPNAALGWAVSLVFWGLLYLYMKPRGRAAAPPPNTGIVKVLQRQREYEVVEE
jgi:hypothetical protein